MRQELEKRFTYHAPKNDQPERYTTLREFAKTFALAIVKFCPDSRERSLAITKLEEVVFWMTASIARNE
jgi:hypothetical protein